MKIQPPPHPTPPILSSSSDFLLLIYIILIVQFGFSGDLMKATGKIQFERLIKKIDNGLETTGNWIKNAVKHKKVKVPWIK